MTLLDRVFGVTPEPAAYAPDDDYWYQPFGFMTDAGIQVDDNAALRVSAVYRAVELKAQTMGRLPLVLMRRLPDERKERAVNENLYEVLHDRPNDLQSAHEFKELMQGILELRGNAYAEIVSGRRGFVDQLLPLHPSIVEKPERLPNGRIRYPIWERGRKRFITQDRMFHIRGFGMNGLTGLSRIELMRQTVGLSLALESHGSRVFTQRANHAGVLEHPGLLDGDAYKRLKQSIEDHTVGLKNSHRTLILEEGMKWQTVGMSNDDAEFILTRTFQLKEIARWFGVPPHKIADLDKASFNNIEEQGIDFVQDGIGPQASRWEGAIKRSLILPSQSDLYAKYVVDALLRGRTKDRYQSYTLAINGGWMSRNEVRMLEDMDRVDGLDDFLEPMNMRRADGSADLQDDEERNGNRDQNALSAGNGLHSQRATKILHDAAARMVRREFEQVQKRATRFASNPDSWERSLKLFYRDHAVKISEVLHLPFPAAERYCVQQRDDLIASGFGVAENWLEQKPKELAQIALSEE